LVEISESAHSNETVRIDIFDAGNRKMTQLLMLRVHGTTYCF